MAPKIPRVPVTQKSLLRALLPKKTSPAPANPFTLENVIAALVDPKNNFDYATAFKLNGMFENNCCSLTQPQTHHACARCYKNIYYAFWQDIIRCDQCEAFICNSCVSTYVSPNFPNSNWCKNHGSVYDSDSDSDSCYDSHSDSDSDSDLDDDDSDSDSPDLDISRLPPKNQ